ncbi:hypothetical protein AT6N2_C2281 [Agrobacterium tumefaciens]|nr:hypothetical protein AT6N2_C2281 [Agrobacterium tumefaciens]
MFDPADLGIDRLNDTLPCKAAFYPLTKIAGIRDLHGLPCLLLPDRKLTWRAASGKARGIAAF